MRRGLLLLLRMGVQCARGRSKLGYWMGEGAMEQAVEEQGYTAA